MQLQLDPKLSLKSVTAGDLLTGDGGSLDSARGAGGLVTLNFWRKTGASDSGTLATLNLQADNAGNAPVLVQSGKYLLGSNEISARVVNALITVN